MTEEYMLLFFVFREKQKQHKAFRAFINQTLAEHDRMQKDFRNGTIGLDEYRGYIRTYTYAYHRNEYFSVIEQHRDYLAELQSVGKDAWFVYDTGWKALFFADTDWLFFSLLLILYVGMFALEYDSRSSSGIIKKSQRKGASAAFYKKRNGSREKHTTAFCRKTQAGKAVPFFKKNDQNTGCCSENGRKTSFWTASCVFCGTAFRMQSFFSSVPVPGFYFKITKICRIL